MGSQAVLLVCLGLTAIQIVTGQLWEFGSDNLPQAVVITQYNGQFSFFQKEQHIQIIVPPCHLVTYVNVQVKNHFATPTVFFNYRTNRVTIQYSVWQISSSHFTITAKAVLQQNCPTGPPVKPGQGLYGPPAQPLPNLQGPHGPPPQPLPNLQGPYRPPAQPLPNLQGPYGPLPQPLPNLQGPYGPPPQPLPNLQAPNAPQTPNGPQIHFPQQRNQYRQADDEQQDELELKMVSHEKEE